jgi:hypothetical protein
MERMAFGPAVAATTPPERVCAGAAAAAWAAPEPSSTTMLLPSTRVLYGTMRSRFSTRRVRSLVSAARIVSRPAALTSMRREGSASAVFGRSKEMRAGLSMVNDRGSVAGPERRMVSWSCWPASVCTSIASSRLVL